MTALMWFFVGMFVGVPIGVFIACFVLCEWGGAMTEYHLCPACDEPCSCTEGSKRGVCEHCDSDEELPEAWPRMTEDERLDDPRHGQGDK